MHVSARISLYTISYMKCKNYKCVEEEFWKLTNRLIFNLSKQEEITEIMSKSDLISGDWHDRDNTDLIDSKDRIISSFLTNLNGIKERYDCLLFKCKPIIGNTASGLLDLMDGEEINYDNGLICLMAKCNSLMNVFLCTCFVEKELSSLDEIHKYPFGNVKKSYFRGQCNYDFGLLPSFYRGLTIDGGRKEITVEFIQQRYDELGILEKYHSLFGEENRFSKDILEYAQHTIAYSPLLDVSESKEIATIFATSSRGLNPNDYLSNDASLYCFYVFNHPGQSGERTQLSLENMRVLYLPRKIKYDEQIRNKHLYEMSYKDFKIRYHFTNSQTNDRAKIQQGHFFFLIDGCIINGHLLIPFNQMEIVKYKIDKKYKKDIYTEIVTRNKQYDIESLMNPYSYFSDYSFKSKS